ncbi:Pyridoxal-5'-phosphate-dependent protein beta subunit [Dyadobacter fermentans DSM 18053]|uniref:Pyridoxal-5'-phosphate-dependent protein beta subunit n=1 Tax=Dyadobacter fermentans (strain ATCC 700827 / DSM 18053 / CIP 107007 / KCTC 52180 / NS114) TaxID=471854 RepID=C6W1R4_DYAFD|nr:Pyridoxal-5'-phosphate-dependent protein beta subunit [Dyadobacter fermentans DSM 18053]
MQRLSNADTENASVQLYVKRDDLIHPAVSGNKWRKLKYNLLDAQARGERAVLTFGGAYSNHLYATAAAGRALGLATIGIVRGLELEAKENPTLRFCREQGMELHFVSRAEYRQKDSVDYLAQLSERFGAPYIVPEGGTTRLALQGVAEMVSEIKEQLGAMPDFIATAAGTGGTAAGILSAGADVLAFSALKGGDFLADDIRQQLDGYTQSGTLSLLTDYHFGGYAKWNEELLDFMHDFAAEFDVRLEQVYTAKMFYGLFDLIKSGCFQRGTTIVAVHTGGLQGALSA